MRVEAGGDSYDVVIIGGGPAGLAAATVLGRALRRVALIDAGQQSNRGSEAVHAVFACDGMAPEELYQRTREQLKRYRCVQLLEGIAVAVHSGGPFSIDLESRQQIEGKYLLLAQGVKYSHPPIPGVIELWGRQVWHCPYCHGFEAAGKRLLAIGDEIWVSGMKELLPIWTENIVWAGPGHVQGLRAEGSQVFACLDGGEQVFDHVVVQSTVVARDEIADNLGCERNGKGQLVIDEKGQTSVERVYCAGDQSTEGGQINIAAAAGHKAAVAINEALGPPVYGSS